ncbi:prolyl oligopeptidase family serine peptidase [Bacteroidota bacterium]
MSLFERKTFQHDTTIINYRIFIPQDDTCENGYPLILTLHGSGERGSDNESHIKHHKLATIWADSNNQKKHPCFILSPQCPENNRWVDADWGFSKYDQDTVPTSNELNTVCQLVDHIINEYPVDINRLYITGLSMGGFGTWDLITRFPGKFVAAIAMSGAGDPSKAPLLTKVPIWVFHGALDKTVPVEGSRNMVDAIRDVGGNVIYTEYEYGAHVIWKESYENPLLIDWLFAQYRK